MLRFVQNRLNQGTHVGNKRQFAAVEQITHACHLRVYAIGTVVAGNPPKTGTLGIAKRNGIQYRQVRPNGFVFVETVVATCVNSHWYQHVIRIYPTRKQNTDQRLVISWIGGIARLLSHSPVEGGQLRQGTEQSG